MPDGSSYYCRSATAGAVDTLFSYDNYTSLNNRNWPAFSRG